MPASILDETTVALDLEAAIANIRREGAPGRVFFFEHGLEPGIKQALCDRFDLCDGLNPSDEHFLLRRQIRLQEFLGQEFMRVFPAGIIWPGLPTKPTLPPPAIGPIQSWQDFDSYPWPRIEQVDFSEMEWFEANLPENIGMWAMTYLFQQVSNLFGFGPLCLLLHDDGDLVEAVIEKVGAFFVKLAEAMCQFSRCAAINIGDDMGHNTSTLMAPDDIRELFIPWHRRIIAVPHAQHKLGFFHVCGQVGPIMDDLIETVKIDARHSTQDAVEPMPVSKQRWGSRVGLLGGVDVHFITLARPDEVRAYTRNILDTCVAGGGFAIGVGNWVADSIPFDNYLAMQEEARC